MTLLRLRQMCAMAYYEMRMLWRQRMMLVLVAFILLMALAQSLFWRVLSTDAALITALGDAALQQQANTLIWINLFWPSVYLPLLLVSGLTVADVLPRDRRLGVDVLIGSTPLSRATYLLGKLGGAWLSLLCALGLGMVVLSVVGLGLVGPYDVGQYLQVWLGGAVPVGLLHVSLCLLLTAFAPNRRAAVAAILFFGLACVVWGTGMTARATLWGVLNPARPFIFGYYWLGWLDSPASLPANLTAAQLSVVAGLSELFGVGLMAWLWLRRCEGRQ